MSTSRTISQKRSDLQRAISYHKARLLQIEKAFSHCDRLEVELPELINQLRAHHTTPQFSQHGEQQDFGFRHDLARQARAIKAAQRLLSDLPAIRAFWTNEKKTLG